jgi:hypothetical protein
MVFRLSEQKVDLKFQEGTRGLVQQLNEVHRTQIQQGRMVFGSDSCFLKLLKKGWKVFGLDAYQKIDVPSHTDVSPKRQGQPSHESQGKTQGFQRNPDMPQRLQDQVSGHAVLPAGRNSPP